MTPKPATRGTGMTAEQAEPDPLRVIGEVQDIHGNPLEIAVYRGTVNLSGRHFGKRQMGSLLRLLLSAAWEAAKWEAHRQRDG